MATALVAIGMAERVSEQVWRQWTITDVLIDRYKLGRGRAIAGQSRGRGLEKRSRRSSAEFRCLSRRA